MQTRCKPGDLAIVVHAQNPSNIGLIVRVEGVFNPSRETHFAESGVVWQCACSRPMTWVRSGKTVHALSGPIPDALLQPIRGQSGPLAGHTQRERSTPQPHAAPVGLSGTSPKRRVEI